MTVLEALALGTPVIVSDGCAGRDSVRHGETGLWFRRGDAGDLTAAMAQMQHDGVAARMSLAAHQAFWRDPPTIARHVREIERIYRAATGTAAATPAGMTRAA